MEDFIVRLRIEEDNKRTEKKMENTYMAKANVVLRAWPIFRNKEEAVEPAIKQAKRQRIQAET